MVAGALLAKAGLWWVPGGCCCGVQEPFSDSTKHPCCSALTVRYSRKGSVVVPAHITQSRLEGLHVDYSRQTMLLHCPEQH